MSTEDQSRSEFEAWMKSEGRGDGFERLNQAHPLYGLEQGDYGSSWTQSDWEAWQASRRTYRASVLEEAAKYLDGLHAEQKGRCNYYAFAANGVRALAAKTQEGQ